MASEYAEKLKDPRWQKKRLEILARDNWTCQACDDTKRTLNIHHFRYIPGIEPWDYSMENFITLCDFCHRVEEETRKATESTLLNVLKDKRYLAEDIYKIYLGIVKSAPCHMEWLDGR